jgi:hypothetical protein
MCAPFGVADPHIDRLSITFAVLSHCQRRAPSHHFAFLLPLAIIVPASDTPEPPLLPF